MRFILQAEGCKGSGVARVQCNGERLERLVRGSKPDCAEASSNEKCCGRVGQKCSEQSVGSMAWRSGAAQRQEAGSSASGVLLPAQKTGKCLEGVAGVCSCEHAQEGACAVGIRILASAPPGSCMVDLGGPDAPGAGQAPDGAEGPITPHPYSKPCAHLCLGRIPNASPGAALRLIGIFCDRIAVKGTRAHVPSAAKCHICLRAHSYICTG